MDLKKSREVVVCRLTGLSTAYMLLLRHLEVSIDLFEVEVGRGKTYSRCNSGILHCGFYYRP